MKSQSDGTSMLRRDEHGLTAKEMKILEFVAKGMTREEIADNLNISVHTVNTHLTSVYRKLKAKTEAQAVAKWLCPHLPPGLTNVFC